MLKITVLGDEKFDNESQMFLTVGDVVLEFEHSLVSLSKWEQIWEKPFLGSGSRPEKETLSYFSCMCLTPDIPPEVFSRMSEENLNDIQKYINSQMTATWFSETAQSRPSREVITADVIYYWMMSLNIPLECQEWHLNRLFTLIRVFERKNSKPKKMSAAERRALNARQQAHYGTTG